MDSSSRDPSLADAASGASKRERTRDSLFLMARLRFANEASGRDVRVRNLSEGGLMAELDRVVPIGTPLSVDLRGVGEVQGKVAWCAEGRMGVALDEPIDPKRARKPVGGGETTPLYAKPLVWRPRPQ